MPEAQYPREYAEKASEIRAFFQAAESGDFESRKQEDAESVRHNKNFHWHDLKTGEVLDDKLSTNFTWMLGEIQQSKVFNGWDFRPYVESQSVYEYDDDDPIKSAVTTYMANSRMQPGQQFEPEVAARLRQAVLRDLYDSEDLESVFKDWNKTSQWVSDSYLLIQWDDDEQKLTFDILMRDQVRTDPEVLDPQDGRAIAYGVKKTIGWIEDHFPKFGHLVQPDHDYSVEDKQVTERPITSLGIGKEGRRQELVTLWCVYWRDQDTELVPDDHTVVGPDEVEQYLEKGWILEEEETE